jgi:ATP-binding cassette subfamily C protein
MSAAFAPARAGFLGAAAFSCVINILGLTGSLYTLQIYDRVIPSRSISTLVALTVLAASLYAAYAVLDFLRGRILSRAGLMITATLERETLSAVSALALSDSTRPHALEPLSDLDRIRTFLSGPGPAAMLDLPWIPVYLAAIYILHPVLGLTVAAAALGLLLLAVVGEAVTKVRRERLATEAHARTALAEAVLRNAEITHAMGLGPGLEARWHEQSRAWLADHTATADTAQLCSAAARLLRLLCQIAIVGLGALLVINGGMSAGAIVAASFIASRALSPVDAGLAHWRGYTAFLESCRRLSENFRAARTSERHDGGLPAPQVSVAVEHLMVMPPGAFRPLIHDLSFKLNAGDGLGVIGASGSGKSSLARALVGVVEHGIRAGSIRLDGAPLSRWASSTRGRYIGYLPQDASLLPGSIGENISRFEARAESAKIILAAKAAGVHDVILRLPDGYHTRIGKGVIQLSTGERQRIALARAFYGDPFLVVLDEPDASLDGAGLACLNDAIRAIRQRGGIVVVLSHRLTTLEGVDLLMSLSNGRLLTFGRKDEVLRRMFDPVPQSQRAAQPALGPQPAPPLQATLKVVSDNQGSGSA